MANFRAAMMIMKGIMRLIINYRNKQNINIL